MYKQKKSRCEPSQRPFQKWFFHPNSNSMELLFCSHLSCRRVIAMKFCTWHDSCAVVACVKFCSNIKYYNGVTWKPIFHWIWITMEKSFIKWALAHSCDFTLKYCGISTVFSNGDTKILVQSPRYILYLQLDILWYKTTPAGAGRVGSSCCLCDY